jgi:C4-dicarboxylate-specific signal transduction histidine kinase
MLHTDEDYLKTILRNLTANAIAAVSEMPEPKINWKAWCENGLCNCRLQTTGGNEEQFSLV